jgi:hypothetical protein
MLFLCSSEAVRSDPGAHAQITNPPQGAVTAFAHQSAFLDAHPGAAFALSPNAGRIERVYGSAFSHGETGEQSAEAFRLAHSRMFGAEPQDVVPVGPFRNGQHVQPIMYQPETDTYKFTGYFYTQQRGGVPVFRSDLRLLVRNEGQSPLVLAAANLRALGDFQVDAVAAGDEAAPASSRMAMKRVKALSQFDGEPQVDSWRRVIWAGVEEMNVAPRLADEFIITLDVDKWLVLTDAVTGVILYEEHQICFVDIEGTVEGSCTIGIGAEQCEPEVPLGLPHMRVTAGANSAFSDVDGNFTISNPGSDPINVSATYDGIYFDVSNYLGGIETVTDPDVTPPGPAYLLFNAANISEQVRAQPNGYKYANVARDFILAQNPLYPTISTETDFPVWVNRTDGYCPGNAWYSWWDSINFCLSGSGYPNTAWTSVIMHEYGHHLVQAGGSGQGEYGEGMGDTLAMLILDDPCTGLGFFGDCGSCLRTADNTCQYSAGSCSTCGSAVHSCGQLLSGCVWSVRNNLIVTEPSDYLTILSSIAVNAVPMHSGSSITSSITVDYLTLDDDNGNILDGTPHYAEINGGFSAHGLAGPDVALLGFDFPEGLPEMVSPSGGTTALVNVVAINEDPQPGTGILHADTGSGFTEYPMNEISPGEYEAVFPASACETTVVYYFSAETTGGATQLWPPVAPAETYSALSAVSINLPFDDDFETDQGWTVTDDPGLTTGTWESGIPAGLGDRGDPPADADGSGQCYVTGLPDGDWDIDGGTTTLTSPIMDASDPDMSLGYWRWYSNTYGADPQNDIFVVDVSDDGGSSWVNLEIVGPSGPEVDGGWYRKEFLVADIPGISNTDQFRVRFLASDLSGGSVVEAGVDGVQVFDIVCDGILGDIDGDGVVNVNDFLLLIGAWGDCPDPCPPSCPADLDGNCRVDVNDFLILLANWGS